LGSRPRGDPPAPGKEKGATFPGSPEGKREGKYRRGRSEKEGSRKVQQLKFSHSAGGGEREKDKNWKKRFFVGTVMGALRNWKGRSTASESRNCLGTRERPGRVGEGKGSKQVPEVTGERSLHHNEVVNGGGLTVRLWAVCRTEGKEFV